MLSINCLWISILIWIISVSLMDNSLEKQKDKTVSVTIFYLPIYYGNTQKYFTQAIQYLRGRCTGKFFCRSEKWTRDIWSDFDGRFCYSITFHSRWMSEYPLHARLSWIGNKSLFDGKKSNKGRKYFSLR